MSAVCTLRSHNDGPIMMTLSTLLAFVREIHQSRWVDSPHKGPVMRSFDVSFLLTLTTVKQTTRRFDVINVMLTLFLCHMSVGTLGISSMCVIRFIFDNLPCIRINSLWPDYTICYNDVTELGKLT